MNILIDDLNYHSARLNNSEIKYVLDMIDKTIKKYPGLDKYIKDTFKANGIVLKKYCDNELIINIFSAFLHSLKDYKEIKNEDQLLKVLRRYVRIFLEPIFINRKQFIGSHPVQYEPKVICVLSASNYINRDVSKKFDEYVSKNKTEEYVLFSGIELINAFRTLKSSMLLFTIGDDVHGIGLYRGFIEIFCKIALIEKFKEDYVKYKKYNVYLQAHKLSNEPLPKEMVDDLGDKCMNENFIAYGWVKDANGKRISSLTELTKIVLKDESYRNFLHLSGEFIHEDYVAVGYDYIILRKNYIDTYFKWTKYLLEEFKETIKVGKYINLCNCVQV